MWPGWDGAWAGAGEGAGSYKGALGSTLARRPWEGFLEEETEQGMAK